MYVKSKLLLASKISLAFVVLGFFLPILSMPFEENINGVGLAKFFVDFENAIPLVKMAKYAVVIWFVPLLALVSIGIYVVSVLYYKNDYLKDENTVCITVDFCVLAGILASVLFTFYRTLGRVLSIVKFLGDIFDGFPGVDDMSSLPDISSLSISAINPEVIAIGAYAIAFGWCASLGFLVLHIIMHTTWDWLDNLKKRIDALYVAAKKRIDTFPVVVQLLIGLLILAGIAAAGIFVLWLIDFVLLDADPIGRAFGLIK